MDIKKISHIGIAVPAIEDHLALYSGVLGLELTGTEVVADQKVKVAFLTVGESRIELLEPTSDDSPIKKFIDSKGGKPAVHHIAYEVSDVEAALAEAKEKGIRLIDEKPRVGAGGVQIAFMHPKATGGVLIELCEQH